MSLSGAYLVNCEAGNAGMPGAPILHFSLVVVAPTGKVSGHATITQAIAPPYGVKEINNVTGQVRYTGYGDVTKIVFLQGTYNEPLPGAAIGFIEVPFEAHFAINNEWNGRGGFSCGTLSVDNVPVRNLQTVTPPITILYGAAIQEASVSGDLNRMKAIAQQAEGHLKNSEAVSAALSALKAEIAKIENS